MDQAKSIINFNEKEFSGTMISNKSNLLNSTTYEVIKQVKSKETIKNISKTARQKVARIGCGEKTKLLNFKKWCLYLSPNME